MKVHITDLFRKALRVGFFHLLSANILIQIAGLGGQIFLTRILTVEEIGNIKVLQSFLVILQLVATSGINIAILKLCSEKITESEKKSYFFTGLKISIFTCAVVVVTTLYLAFSNSLTSSLEINKLMKIFIFQVPFLVLINYGMAYLQSQKRMKVISNLQSGTRIVVIFFSVISAYVFGIHGYITGIVVSNAISFMFIAYIYRRSFVDFKRYKIKKPHMKRILNLGGFSFGTSILSQLILTSNIIMASYMMVDTEQIAFFGIAHLIMTTMMMIPFSLNQIMIPYLSEQTGNPEKIKELLRTYQKRMLLIMVPMVIVAYFLVPMFIPLIFGIDYINSIEYFRILLIGLFCWSLFSPTNNVLTSIGKIDYNLYTYIFAFAIYIPSNFFLIKSLGMVGAAIATSLTYLLTIFINKYFYKKHISNQLND